MAHNCLWIFGLLRNRWICNRANIFNGLSFIGCLRLASLLCEKFACMCSSNNSYSSLSFILGNCSDSPKTARLSEKTVGFDYNHSIVFDSSYGSKINICLVCLNRDWTRWMVAYRTNGYKMLGWGTYLVRNPNIHSSSHNMGIWNSSYFTTSSSKEQKISRNWGRKIEIRILVSRIFYTFILLGICNNVTKNYDRVYQRIFCINFSFCIRTTCVFSSNDIATFIDITIAIHASIS